MKVRFGSSWGREGLFLAYTVPAGSINACH